MFCVTFVMSDKNIKERKLNQGYVLGMDKKNLKIFTM